ncbi:hypothetical protein GCM10010331_70590 [Streptomyces xanthochromogenes]|uniref:hypothetical protein n=1 Tax=Streptomyces xanthochromogenes TaxID=67384 RepID=UPI0016721F28|nr:hypothetical protein [Streptomyces xanthochromogenes]GHB72340.1 hypothetical protein GCM10010331_70590 [Streptomyces xanthochromogenes]
MSQIEVAFPERIPARLGPELTRRVLYLDEDIDDFALIEDGDEITGLRLVGPITRTARPESLIETLMQEAQGLRSVEPKRVWSSRRPSGPGSGIRADDVIRELIDAGDARVHGPGTISLRGAHADLLTVLDDMFAALSMDVAGAEHHRFPTLLGTSVLERGGYLESFPNLLLTVNRLRNTSADFERFRDHRRSGGSLNELESATIPVEYCLPPTMCYYIYDSHVGTRSDELRVLTAVGSSFRFEHRYESPLRRLWDFTIRETVWIGERDDVRRGLERYRGLVTALCDELGLAGLCESAHDPFFLADNGAAKAAAQQMIGSKTELRLFLDDDETVAAASFNQHGQHLAAQYDIGLSDGAPASTACVGIGLERFTLAFLAQHGTDPRRWPSIVARAVAAQADRPGRVAVREWVSST